ncbi:hypothetical protein RA267_28035, partial [Pseudomonas syringae pv. tagetis]
GCWGCFVFFFLLFFFFFCFGFFFFVVLFWLLGVCCVMLGLCGLCGVLVEDVLWCDSLAAEVRGRGERLRRIAALYMLVASFRLLGVHFLGVCYLLVGATGNQELATCL